MFSHLDGPNHQYFPILVWSSKTSQGFNGLKFISGALHAKLEEQQWMHFSPTIDNMWLGGREKKGKTIFFAIPSFFYPVIII